MNRNHLGSPLSDSVEEWSKDPAFRQALQDHREKLEMSILLRKLREKEGLSQRQLAIRASIPQSVIARIESMNSKVLPRLDLFSRLLDAMGYRVSLHAKKSPRRSRRTRLAA